MSKTLSKTVRSIRANLTKANADLAELEAVLEDMKQQGKPETEIVTIDEMADILQISITTLRRYLKAGKLEPAYRKGKQYYWLRSELQEVLRNSKD